MIRTLYLIRTESTDPYRNLALEKGLLQTVQKGQCILYLWQNEKTVVIGRNQNAWAECDPSRLEKDGAHLARRLSGGGAVFHDLGNLNFTFLSSTDDSDRQKETEVILEAVRSFGIHAERTGRNDLICEGRKFSGHAYYRSGGAAFHHGTVMISVDQSRLSDYLHVSPFKMQKSGVPSVRSRVMNLQEICPDLTVMRMAEALELAFSRVYGLPCNQLPESIIDSETISHERAVFASPSWIWRDSGPLPHHTESMFPEGLFRLDYETVSSCGGTPVFRKTLFSSDTLETDFDFTISHKLTDCPVNTEAAVQKLGKDADSPAGRVLIHLIQNIGGNHHV